MYHLYDVETLSEVFGEILYNFFARLDHKKNDFTKRIEWKVTLIDKTVYIFQEFLEQLLVTTSLLHNGKGMISAT